MSSTENRELRQELEATRDELKKIAQQIRLDAHLASMEAKDAWAELQPRLSDFEGRVEDATRELGAELASAGRTLLADLKTMKERMK